MKKFISKVKKATKDFFTNKSAFSLVELIVVIAIMAVMAAILAPALLGYVEKSRMQKDASIMSEVVNSMKLSIADQEIYDELLQASVKDNYSCYADGDTTTNIDANKTMLKEPEYWLYNDNCRLLDETIYNPTGKMRGVTITFRPNGEYKYVLADGIINQTGNNSTSKGLMAGKLLSDASFEATYNRLRSTIGDVLNVSSQTYRNSDYTIFISLGTTGGNEAIMQDAIQVWGQYNGTNLPEVTDANDVVGGSQQARPPQANDGKIEYGVNDPDLNHNGIIPENAIYHPNPGKNYYGGEEFPDKIGGGATYIWGDYEYTYYSADKGWGPRVRDKTKKEYEPILESINGAPVTSFYYAFQGCEQLETVPLIPKTVTNMRNAFSSCKVLAVAPEIPDGVTNMYQTFWGCGKLEHPPVLPEGLIDMGGTFTDCSAMQELPIIPSTVTSLDSTFYQFRAKTYVGSKEDDYHFKNYIIPSGVTSMQGTFAGNGAMITTPKVPENVINASDAFGYLKWVEEITLPCSLKIHNYTYTNVKVPITYYHTSTCDGSCEG